MGGVFGSEKKTQTVTNEVPAYISDAHASNLDTARLIGAQPYVAYDGARIAGPTTDQTRGAEVLRAAVGSWQPELTASAAAVRAMADYVPEHIGANTAAIAPQPATTAQINRGSISDINAGQVADTDLTKYLNPFTQSVVSTTAADIQRQGDQADQAVRARYAAGGAFGGSRQAVAQAENARNTTDIIAKTIAGLRADGYNNAVQNANADLNRRLTADQANQGTSLAAATSNMAAANDMNRFAVSTDLQARQYNADDAFRRAAADQTTALNGQRLSLDAAGVLGDLSKTRANLGLADASALYGLGNSTQLREQQALDTAYQDWASKQNWPKEQLNWQQGLLSGVPYTTSTSQPIYQNNTANTLSAVSSIASMFI
jgi:hypothetical protein